MDQGIVHHRPSCNHRSPGGPERLLERHPRYAALAAAIVREHHVDPPIFGGQPWFELSALYVAPSHRRAGVARLLTEHLEAWARAHGYDTVQLYVSAANHSARDFYARQGYAPLQEIWRKELPPA